MPHFNLNWVELSFTNFKIIHNYMYPLVINSSAICTEFKAAPFLKLSETTQIFNPKGIVWSSRILETKTE